MVSFYCFGRGTFRAFSGGLTKKVWWSSIRRPGHLCTLCDICNQYELPSICKYLQLRHDIAHFWI